MIEELKKKIKGELERDNLTIGELRELTTCVAILMDKGIILD